MSRMLGRYELLEQLGEGGMGAVFLARLTGAAGFEKLCIVKTVLPSIAKDAEFVSRFLHEGRVLTQLSHGNIAQVLDMSEHEGTLFLALEYVAGVDVARLHEQVRAQNELMPVPLVVLLGVQAAEGLGAAHRKTALDGSPLNIVHRDVSPHNVMVSYDGEAKVIDFGIAKSEARSRHTAQASVMGKLGYMAPEQARGESVDHRADQYALGIVLWELLSNQSFVKRGTLTEMVVAMANPSVRLLSPLRPEVPLSLEQVILKSLAPRADDRFPTTDAFAQALMGELLALGAPPSKPELGEYVRTRCSQDFATQRQLLTRVTTQRSIALDETGRPRVDPQADTSVRPGPPVPTLLNTPAPTTGNATLHARPLTSPVQGETQAMTPSSGTAAPATTGLSEPVEDGPTRQSAAVSPKSPAATAVPGLSKPVEDGPSKQSPPTALTTGEMRAAAPSRTPLYIGIGVVVVVLLAIAVVMTPHHDDATKPPAVGAVTPPTPTTPSPTPATPTPPSPTPPTAPPDALVDAGSETPTAAPPEPTDAGLAPPPPVEDEQPTLRLAGRRSPTSWIITNGNATTWTNCTMTVPGQRAAKVGKVIKGSSVELEFRKFVADKTARALVKQARVDCDQGFGVMKAP